MDTEPRQPRCLFVFVHGNNGAASDWDALEGALKRVAPHCACFRFSTHQGKRTLVGVEALADALLAQLEPRLASVPAPPLPLYLVGHSLGGLVARAALPLLEKRGVRVVGLCTIATPHIGVARPGGTFAKNVVQRATERACRDFYEKTGSDLIYGSLTSREHTLQETLLYRLADPAGPFYAALERVPHRTLVASPFLDMLVPYATASAQEHTPYDEEELASLSSDQPCCVWGYSGFSPEQAMLIAPFARAGAAGRPDGTDTRPRHLHSVPSVSVHDDVAWWADRHRFCRWPEPVMRNLRSLSFRRLDVQLDVPSRWLVHDAFLKKSWRNILPDSGVAGDQCVTLLAALLARDIA